MNMLTKQQILLLHSQLIRQSGGSEGIRDEGMLDSAISQPFQTFDDMELYPGIVDKTVRLGYGLITNHPFVDGNKRIGTHTLLVTLDINGIELQYQDDDLINLILKIASGNADDRDEPPARPRLPFVQRRVPLDPADRAGLFRG